MFGLGAVWGLEWEFGLGVGMEEEGKGRGWVFYGIFWGGGGGGRKGDRGEISMDVRKTGLDGGIFWGLEFRAFILFCKSFDIYRATLN